MTALLALLRGATVDDRELDAKIARELGWGCVMRDPEAKGEWYCWKEHYRSGEWIPLPFYTSCIEDALSLAPDGWEIAIYLSGTSTTVQMETEAMRQMVDFYPIESEAPTPALAICIACSMARLYDQGIML